MPRLHVAHVCYAMSRLPHSYRRGRIRKCDHPLQGLVDTATLQRVPHPGGDALRPSSPPTGSAQDILTEADVTVTNVRLAPSAVFRRCRARNVHARYERIRTEFDGHKIGPFTFTLDDMEGTESAHVRVLNLLSFVEASEIQITKLEREMPHKQGETACMRKASRGGGCMKQMLKLKDDAVRVKIERRKRTDDLVPVDNDDDTDRSVVDNIESNTDAPNPTSDNTPRTLYPAAFKYDVEQINLEMDMEEASVKKLSVNGKWLLASANAVTKDDMGIVESLDLAEANRQAAKNRQRARRK